MINNTVGYEFIRQALGQRLLPVTRHAQIGAVTRVEQMGDLLAIPRSVAPRADMPTRRMTSAC